jgi:hypothetical protein
MDDLRQGMGAVRKIITIISDLAAVGKSNPRRPPKWRTPWTRSPRRRPPSRKRRRTFERLRETVKASESVSEQAMRLSERAAQLKGEISRFKLSGGSGLVRA